jgi:hypothetical protein
MIFVSFSIEKNLTPALTEPLLSHLTSCTPTKSNLFLANSLATAVRELDLHRLLSFRLPNITFLFHCLRHAKGSVQPPGTCVHFITRPVLMVRNCYHLTQPQVGRPPTVSCLRLLIQYIHSYPPYWRPFLHPQPEDIPHRGDKDPLTMDAPQVTKNKKGNVLPLLN